MATYTIEWSDTVDQQPPELDPFYVFILVLLAVAVYVALGGPL